MKSIKIMFQYNQPGKENGELSKELLDFLIANNAVNITVKITDIK